MNDQNIFWVDLPYEKDQKIEECQRINFDECSIFFDNPFRIKEYNLSSQSSESSLEQLKWNF